MICPTILTITMPTYIWYFVTIYLLTNSTLFNVLQLINNKTLLIHKPPNPSNKPSQFLPTASYKLITYILIPACFSIEYHTPIKTDIGELVYSGCFAVYFLD